MRSVDGRWGKTYFYGKDMYVGRSLFHYGEYNPDETEKIIDLASEACCISYRKLCLDIGANFGVMSQALTAVGFDCIAFEPQPVVFDVLRKNHLRCENVALGAAEGVAKMPRFFADANVNYGGAGIGYRSDLGTISVEVRTLDSYEYNNVGFIKIDVEGFEEQVLRGGTETITRDKPIMYIEDDRAELSRSLRAYITSLGYSIEEHQPLLYREDNFFGLKKNVWDKLYASHNIICRPIAC